MRPLPLLLLLSCAFSCSKKSDDKTTEVEPASEPQNDDTTGGAEAEPTKQDVSMDCEGWKIAELVQKACGEEVALTESDIIPDDDMACRRSGKSASGTHLSVVIGNVKMGGHKGNSKQYPPDPVTGDESGKRKTRMGAFPYSITIEQRGGAEKVCSDDEAAELARAIANVVPQQEGAEYTPANAACDELLSSEHLQKACGKPGELRATEMEDGDKVYCNRVGPGGLIFIVSQHESPEQASAAEKVASGGEHTVVGTSGAFLVEIKSSPSEPNPHCDDAALAKLLEGVVARLQK